jgi:hypothetical protein
MGTVEGLRVSVQLSWAKPIKKHALKPQYTHLDTRCNNYPSWRLSQSCTASVLKDAAASFDLEILLPFQPKLFMV